MQMLEMGFEKSMVEALLVHEDIDDVNLGVEMLMKGQNGWIHRFRPERAFGSDVKCQICGEIGTEHENVRNQQSIVRLFDHDP